MWTNGPIGLRRKIKSVVYVFLFQLEESVQF
jgi:hypothetical protein